MKVMPGVIGQIGQSVADNLYEIGQSAVKATTDVVPGLVKTTVEQIGGYPVGVSAANSNEDKQNGAVADQRSEFEKRRFDEVRAELETYIRRKKELDAKIAEEKKMEEGQKNQENIAKKQERESWAKRIINRAATTTERGRMAE